jgi:hypothetical protein
MWCQEDTIGIGVDQVDQNVTNWCQLEGHKVRIGVDQVDQNGASWCQGPGETKLGLVFFCFCFYHGDKVATWYKNTHSPFFSPNDLNVLNNNYSFLNIFF